MQLADPLADIRLHQLVGIALVVLQAEFLQGTQVTAVIAYGVG
jgi:hypothetical protein